tara:strand:+ start:1116 stop:1367 length:252 start_codon:yes stop_codon:yes gene_type:complete
MSNEFDTVVFQDYKILTTDSIDENECTENDTYDGVEDEVSNENISNIYSDEHIWDSLPMRRYRNRPEIWMIPILPYIFNNDED